MRSDTSSSSCVPGVARREFDGVPGVGACGVTGAEPASS